VESECRGGDFSEAEGGTFFDNGVAGSRERGEVIRGEEGKGKN